MLLPATAETCDAEFEAMVITASDARITPPAGAGAVTSDGAGDGTAGGTEAEVSEVTDPELRTACCDISD